MAEEQNGNIQEIENEEFDTKGLLLDYLSNWKWFVLGVVVCVALGYFYIQSVIPTGWSPPSSLTKAPPTARQ